MAKKAQSEIEIVVATDRDRGILDLRVFATQSKSRLVEVGTATLRMQDLLEVVRLLAERLRMEDLLAEADPAARRSRRTKSAKPRFQSLLQPLSD